MKAVKEMFPAESERNLQDVAVLISAEDFPGDEKIVADLLPEMYEEYRESAQIASLSFHRGSVLFQEGEQITHDMVLRML